MAENQAEATLAEQRRHYEQTLMRIGRRLEALGQLLVQDPARIVGKGFDFDARVTGERPVQIDLAELRKLFDSTASSNIGQLLAEYHAVVARGKPAS
jgi:hypothetical protein